MVTLFRRRRFLVAALVLILVLIGAVAAVPAARLAVVNAPSLWFDGEIVSDLVYDRKTDQRLDLYLPSGEPGAVGWPVIVFLHGGRWQEGRKDDYRFVGMALAAHGYLVAIPDYRKYPAVRFPAFVEDAAAAVARVSEEIADYGGDPKRIFLSGHSAGAHIGALLASDARYLAAQGLTSKAIRGFAGLAGPYHFTPKAPDLVEMFGPPDRFPEMQASRFIDGDEPPMLLLYGLDDETVNPVNLERMETALAARGVCHRAIRYPGLDHIEIVSALTWIYRDRRPVLDDMLAFFGQAGAGRPCA